MCLACSRARRAVSRDLAAAGDAEVPCAVADGLGLRDGGDTAPLLRQVEGVGLRGLLLDGDDAKGFKLNNGGRDAVAGDAVGVRTKRVPSNLGGLGDERLRDLLRACACLSLHYVVVKQIHF